MDKPTVLDTARLQSGGITVTLFGIEGQNGDMVAGLQSFLASAKGPIKCEGQADQTYVCLMPDGTDVAQAAIINGAARAKANAPQSYQDQQLAAQNARRGIWSSLPPPPEEVRHPAVPDTATLVSGPKTYHLDGLEGFGQPYSGQLQGYITGAGDTLTCNPEVAPGSFTCLLPDGTDIAKVALVNGAARVSEDAPDAYRLQQANALANKRGFWATPQGTAMIATFTDLTTPVYPLVVGDDGSDGITYVGGEPTALIDGSLVFLTFVGAAGWGYYDHSHQWHDAPGRYRDHLDHFHPHGEGLRGYDHGERRQVAFARPGFERGRGFEPGRVEGPGGRPGLEHRPGFEPGRVEGPGARPGLERRPGGEPVRGEPPGRPGAMVNRAGPTPGPYGGQRPMPAAARPAGPAPGFVRPGPSAAGFHPAAMPAPHPAPVAVAHAAPAPAPPRKK